MSLYGILGFRNYHIKSSDEKLVQFPSAFNVGPPIGRTTECLNTNPYPEKRIMTKMR